MKDRNAYTVSLFSIGLLFAGWLPFALPSVDLAGIAPFLLLFVIAGWYPIRLPNGETFSIGPAVSLVLLLEYGLAASLIGNALGITTYFLKLHRSPVRLPWFRIVSSIGLYGASSSAVLLVLSMLGLTGASDYAKAFVGVTVFEAAAGLLMAGVMKSVYGLPLLERFDAKLKKLAVTAVLFTVLAPHFMLHGFGPGMLGEFLVGLLLIAGVTFLSRAYSQELRLREHHAEEFTRLFESKISPNMEGHGTRVGIICEALFLKIDFPARDRKDLVQAAIMHDIGKLLLPPHVFTKRGALSLKEEAEYQSHSDKGADIVRTFFSDEKMHPWILHHHERHDGKGYPHKLSGDAIPLGARMLALANRLDHLMTRQETDEAVMTQLMASSGKELDPDLASRIDLPFVRMLRAATADSRRRSEAPAEAARGQEDFRQEAVDIGRAAMLRYRVSERRFAPSDADAPYGPLQTLALRAAQEDSSFHEIIPYGGTVLQAHFFPEGDEVRVFLVDITQTQRFKQTFENNAMRSYKEVIQILSENKVNLCLAQEELANRLGDLLGAVDVVATSDVAKCRNFVTDFLTGDSRKLMHVKLAVSEATTNVIKHAEKGRLSVYRKGDALQVLVSDRGSGIPLHELPKTVLVSGYSSKSSLGKGFSLIYRAADEVALHTSPEGLYVLLTFHSQEGCLRLNGANQQNSA